MRFAIFDIIIIILSSGNVRCFGWFSVHFIVKSRFSRLSFWQSNGILATIPLKTKIQIFVQIYALIVWIIDLTKQTNTNNVIRLTKPTGLYITLNHANCDNLLLFRWILVYLSGKQFDAFVFGLESATFSLLSIKAVILKLFI